MAKRGRPGGPTIDKINELERLIGAGLSQSAACAVAGIPHRTFDLWLSEAQAGKPGLYVEFLRAITRARGRAEAGAIARIQKADDWRAASWWLSHHPATRDRWSDAGAERRTEQRILGEVVKVLEHELAGDPQLRHRLFTAMIAAGLGEIPREGDGDGE